MLIIDFENAFDSMNKECVWHALYKRGTPKQLIIIIRATYDRVEYDVLHRGKVSKKFEVRSGIRRGCILLPIPFLLIISDVLHATLARGRGHVECYLSSHTSTTLMIFACSITEPCTLTEWL